jgi:hypothetical protein
MYPVAAALKKGDEPVVGSGTGEALHIFQGNMERQIGVGKSGKEIHQPRETSRPRVIQVPPGAAGRSTADRGVTATRDPPGMPPLPRS